MNLKINKEFESLIPALTTEEYQGLEESVKKEGCRDAIVIWNNAIVDGHNRYKICKAHNISFKTIERNFDSQIDAKIWIIYNQFNRRNLTSYQRCLLALGLEEIFREKGKKNQKATQLVGRGIQKQDIMALQKSAEPLDTRKELAKIAGVSHDTIMKVKKIESQVTPEEKEQLVKGEISIHKGYTAIIRKERKIQNESLKEKNPKNVEGLYDVIVIDPPWPIEKIERECRPKQPKEIDYPVMTLNEISEISIPTAEDCHIFLWTTHKFLPESFNLFNIWNFKYVCTFVWHKNGGFQPFGLPQYNCEFILYGRKGSPKFADLKAFNVCFNATRGKHSEKPLEFYETIKRVTNGKRLDMFSRRKIDGFDSWGNEVD